MGKVVMMVVDVPGKKREERQKWRWTDSIKDDLREKAYGHEHRLHTKVARRINMQMKNK